MVRSSDENARREMAGHNSLMDPSGKKDEGRTRWSWQDGIIEVMKRRGGGGWGKKTPRTGYFGEED
jgi:hypothetical protein